MSEGSGSVEETRKRREAWEVVRETLESFDKCIENIARGENKNKAYTTLGMVVIAEHERQCRQRAKEEAREKESQRLMRQEEAEMEAQEEEARKKRVEGKAQKPPMKKQAARKSVPPASAQMGDVGAKVEKVRSRVKPAPASDEEIQISSCDDDEIQITGFTPARKKQRTSRIPMISAQYESDSSDPEPTPRRQKQWGRARGRGLRPNASLAPGALKEPSDLDDADLHRMEGRVYAKPPTAQESDSESSSFTDA